MSNRPANVRGLGLVVQSRVINPRLVQNFNLAMKTLKANSVFFFAHNLLILSSKKNWENYPEKYFWTKKKTWVKI